VIAATVTVHARFPWYGRALIWFGRVFLALACACLNRAVSTVKVAGLCLTLVGAGASEVDDYCQRDKVLHFAGGAAIGATTYALVQIVAPDLEGWKKHAVAIGVSALVGLAKEACDYFDPENHTCDARDAIATAAGGALGSVSVSLVFRF